MSSLGAYRRNGYDWLSRGKNSDWARFRGIALALDGSGEVEATPIQGKSVGGEAVEGDSLTLRDALVARWPVLLAGCRGAAVCGPCSG